jgi:hypothetical protein
VQSVEIAGGTGLEGRHLDDPDIPIGHGAEVEVSGWVRPLAPGSEVRLVRMNAR